MHLNNDGVDLVTRTVKYLVAFTMYR